MLTIRLPIDLESRLIDLADKIGTSQTAIVREAIISQIDSLENKYLLREATSLDEDEQC